MSQNLLVMGAYSLGVGTYVALALLFILLAPRQRTHQLLAFASLMLALNYGLLQLVADAYQSQAPARQILNLERLIAYFFLLEGYCRLAGTISFLGLSQERIYRRLQQAVGAGVSLNLVLLLPIFDRFGAGHILQASAPSNVYPVNILNYLLSDYPFMTLTAVIGLGTLLVVNFLNSYIFFLHRVPKRATIGSVLYIVALVAAVIPAAVWLVPWVMMGGGLFIAHAVLQGTLFDPLRSANGKLALSIDRAKALAHQLEQTVASAEEAVIDRTSALTNALQRERRLAGELEASLQLESELNNLKSKIITHVSHEFRTPLTIIKSSAKLLSEYQDNLSHEKQAQYRHQVNGQIAYLDEMLKDVLFISDTGRHGVEPDWKNYLFGELIVRLSQAWRAACGPEAEMRIAVFGDEATIVETDADLLIAIGNYLVSNASKFTVLAPQIYISLRLESQQLRIAFNDNGIGVPAGEEELIFNIFYRGSNVDQQRGMGLGLFSARKISQALQGNLVLAESSVAGSSFVLTVPISAHHNLAHPVEMMAA